eukprot:3447649-Alexandrium_andersonii.AAC.1
MTTSLRHAPCASARYLSLGSGRRQEIVRHVFGSSDNPDMRPSLGTPAELAVAYSNVRTVKEIVSVCEFTRRAAWVGVPRAAAGAGHKRRPQGAWR